MAKSNNGSRETRHTIKSRYACVWTYICGVDIWWKWYENIVDLVEKVKTWWKHDGNIILLLLLGNIPLFWNLETLARDHGLSFFLSLFLSFFRQASKYPLF